jgi:hypothetical protein
LFVVLEGSLGFKATLVRRFGKEFWQGTLKGSLGFGPLFIKDTFVMRFSKAF